VSSKNPLRQRAVSVAGLQLQLLEQGAGAPVVILHHSTGNLGWTPLFELLSQDFAVIVPDMPGFGRSERPTFARAPRDLAILLNGALDELELDGVHLVGLGLGGWVAAEMATMTRARLCSLALVSAPGIRPLEGFVFDQMLVSHEEYVRLGFRDEESYLVALGAASDEALQLWDFSREMTARISWKPYMTSLQLPHLLPLVTTPTLVVRGSEDCIIPADVADQYVAALPNARLELLQGVGHTIDLEEPELLAGLISKHAAAATGERALLAMGDAAG
jgi:pimeloyl-ACP methyl ester carboxylesterase